MDIGVVGISRSSATFADRERVARACRAEGFAFSLGSCVPLTTCNRTEFYFSSPRLREAYEHILYVFEKEVKGFPPRSLYARFGKACFLHLSRVVSGMESHVFGESDIQRQVKVAYETVRKERVLASELHYLFQKGLKIGKEMRSMILPREACLPDALRALIGTPGAERKRFLFIGNSAINRSMIFHLLRRGLFDITLCTRTGKRPFRSVTTVGWQEGRRWFAYDVVVAATYHEKYVIAEDSEKRGGRVMLFDLGMPRNIDPSLSTRAGLSLYGIDDVLRSARCARKENDPDVTVCNEAVERLTERQMTLFMAKKERRAPALGCTGLA
ncbi:MAG: hypothetical protein OXF02_03915 [Simkaniaceae bacterium]|nr:hypothetical protein [Simkaniaceae bacterium]